MKIDFYWWDLRSNTDEKIVGVIKKIVGVINLGNRFFVSTLSFSSLSLHNLSSPRSALSSSLIQAVIVSLQKVDST